MREYALREEDQVSSRAGVPAVTRAPFSAAHTTKAGKTQFTGAVHTF